MRTEREVKIDDCVTLAFARHYGVELAEYNMREADKYGVVLSDEAYVVREVWRSYHA